ncbi:MAG TPA: cyclic nucleotide-binding domain-containing protein [Candidatus Cloacimonetes bacterium]|nr:cyclic nucleotide-binding domain-containing protein [Candidatus Cloacimonadota bacterium]
MKLFQENEAQKKDEEKELVKFLSKVTIFNKLSKKDLKNLRQYFYLRNFKSGEIIFKKDYPNVVFYILKQGELKVFLKVKDKEIELDRIKPQQYFGEMGIFLEEKRSASIVALEDSEVLAISKADLKNFIDKFPRAGNKILFKFGEILCTHVMNLNKKINEMEEA